MLEVPDMYGALDLRFFDPLFTAGWLFLASQSQDVGYTHPRGADTKLPGSVAPDVLGFFPQAIHQHGQAYIDALGLQDILQVSDVLTLPTRAVENSLRFLLGARKDRQLALGAIGQTAEVL